MKNEKGFTLVEVIISIVLVSIILVSMLTTLVKLKEVYSDVHENSDALVYSSSIARIINNDVMNNNGIRYVTCDTYGKSCNIILGNDRRRVLEIDTKSESEYEEEKDANLELERTNYVTTLKYTDVTDGANDIVYIRTLESNIYTTNKCNGEGKENNRCKNQGTKDFQYQTSDGYNFYRMISDQYSYTDNNSNLTDVVTNIKIYIYDGINEGNLDYAANVYASGRYDDAVYKGKRFRLELDDKGSDERGTPAIDEIFGVNFFEANTNNVITSITIPKKNQMMFEGYYYQPQPSSPEVAIIDSEGNIVIRSNFFLTDELIDYSRGGGNIKAHWARCFNGYDYDSLTGVCKQKEYTVKLDPTPTDGGSTPLSSRGTEYVNTKYKVSLPNITIPTRPGYKFKGYYTSDGSRQ